MEGKIATPQSVKIAQRLRSLRESVGLNTEQLSRAIYEKSGVKIGRNSIINYEVGESYNTKTDKNLGMRAEYVIALADFYGVSTDYLLGLSDVPSNNADIQAAGETTGLTVEAIQHLERMKNMTPELSAVLSVFLENFNLNYFLSLLRSRFQYAAPEYHVPPEIKMQDGAAHMKNARAYHESISKREVKVQFDGIALTADKANLLDSMITASLLADLKEMAEIYLDKKKGENTYAVNP